MILVNVDEREKYLNRFSACEDACILSAVSGMNGDMYIDNEADPRLFVINVSDYTFIAGDPETESISECLSFVDGLHKEDYNIRCVDKELEAVVESFFKDRISPYSRFATERTFKYMDPEALKANTRKPGPEFSFAFIDRALFEKCKKTEWMHGFVVSYETYEEFEKTGLGVMILKDGEPVSGASSYSSYPGGIEVEIITREDHRKKGLARAAGSALILECMKRGLVASWDAAHEKSLELAKSLGYRFLYEYKIYRILDPWGRG